MERLRVASMQYYIRPVQSFGEFAEQVTALVETAADYRCRLVIFPEYLTVQLLTLGDTHRPVEMQIRHLARQQPRYVDLMSGLAKEHALYLVGGTMPTLDNGDGDTVYNDCYVFGPSGDMGVQGKLHMTRFEREEWLVSPRTGLTLFDTEFGRLAVSICYDVEFPEIARVAAREGAKILAVPSCTDERQGYLRVRYCAHARAIENQMYVIHSPTVGSLPKVPAVSLNYGVASILTPSDFAFSRDGILAEGNPNQEMMVIGDLNLETIEQSRTHGTVLPLEDSRRTGEVIREPRVVSL